MVAFAFKPGTAVACEAMGLSGSSLSIHERIEGPDRQPFYTLKSVRTGLVLPGRYSEQLLRKGN